jgi:penicillin-binding protein 1A
MRPRAHIANRSDGGVVYWLLRLYVFAMCFVLVSVVVTAISVYGYFAAQAPPPPNLSRYANVVPAVSRMLAADGTLLGEFAEEWREVVPYDRIPEELVHAFLAAEDHQFFEHRGLYFKGIARAVWRNLVAGDFAQGGSTITQQVAKQFLGNEKSLTRKAKEAIVARRLEALYSKEAILSAYMNHIYLGNGAYGVKAAAERYFNKDLDQLTLAEMAMIAGLAQAPTRYSPVRSPQRARERRDDVLDKMVRYGFLDEAKAAAAKKEKLAIFPYKDLFGTRSPYFAEHVRRQISEDFGHDLLLTGGLRIETTLEPVTDGIAYDNARFGAARQDKRQGWRGPEAYLDSEKARQLFRERAQKLYGKKPLESGRHYLALVESVQNRGAVVRVGSATYDLPLSNMRWAHQWSQRDAINDQTISDAHKALKPGDVIWVAKDEPVSEEFADWQLVGPNPRWVPKPSEERLERLREESTSRVVLEQVPHPQAAILTADHATGYVVAMVGGTNFGRSQFNRAVQACRQPGSTYKPIYYSAALDIGYGFDTVLTDVPHKEVDPVTGEVWTPTNFDNTMDTQVSLEYALVFSKNVPSVSVFSKVGADNVEKWARRLGFTSKIIADKALALGASCTYLDELTRAFAIFARNGRWVDWVYIRRILDRNGNLIEDNSVYYDPMLPAADRLDRLFMVGGREPKQAISARTAYLTSKLLHNVIEHGFATVVRQTGIQAAGKTGTSSATMDTLFVGYTSRWITAVWLGDDMRERELGKTDAAYMTVVPVWARYMAAAAVGHPNKEIPWEVPPGVDPDDRGDHKLGGRARMSLEYRKGGTSPPPPEN